MAQTDSGSQTSADDLRLFPIVDRVFILFIALEFLAFPFVPLLPVAIAALALATRLRRSRRRMVVLWIVGGILTLVAVAPYVLRLFNLQLVDIGPVHTAAPR